jgi:hypothetical protein
VRGDECSHGLLSPKRYGLPDEQAVFTEQLVRNRQVRSYVSGCLRNRQVRSYVAGCLRNRQIQG